MSDAYKRVVDHAGSWGPSAATPTAASTELDSGVLSTKDVVFVVLGGVAPMATMVAILSLSIALGVGAGVPGTYLIAGGVLALFAVGYVRMSRRIANAGAFYVYATRGLGERSGGATAYVALLSYNAATIGILGGFAYFAHAVGVSVVGIDLPWQVWAFIAFALVAVLCWFDVRISAGVLGLALLGEVLILLVFDAAVLSDKGFHGFSLEVFKPSFVFAGGFGVSLMLAFGSYTGFEAAALYSEEARDPHRTVPRATYIAIATITAFYLVTTWAAISAYGIGQAQAAAARDPSVFLFAANAKYVGGFANDAMQVLVVTSLFGAYLAFTTNTARYHFALARDRLVPRAMQRTHPKYGSPIAASGVQLALTAAVVTGFALAGQDPYLQLGTSLYGLGVLGIVLLQCIGSVAVVGFFRRDSRGESKWGTLVAPGLAAVGLACGLVLMVDNYSLLTGSTQFWANHLPWLLPVVAVLGAVVAHTVRARHPREAAHVGDERPAPARATGNVPV